MIETHRLHLSRLSLSHAPQIFQIFGDADVMKYWIGGADTTIKETQQRIVEINQHWLDFGFGDWGIFDKSSGHLIGYGGLHYISDMVEVNLGYAFAQSVWRRSYALESCQAILKFVFEELNLSEIVAVIWPENRVSINLAQRLGLSFWQATTWQGGARVIYKISQPSFFNQST